MSTFDQIVSMVEDTCSHAVPTVDKSASPHALIIAKEDIVVVCRILQENPLLYFDMLSSVTGIDNGPESGTMEIAYNLYSIPFDVHLMIKIALPRDNPQIDSVSGIWKTANWHEREIFDLYGIHFVNHPDLRRILLPADWEGHPLRKDYSHQEYYRDIKVKY
jgi:NADH-quinone oxidoreductase subunit C